MESACHLRAIEKPLLLHHVFEQRDLALVDEQRELAGLPEVRLSGEERQRLDAIIVFERHGSRRRGEQRSAKTVTGRVNLVAFCDLADGIDCRHHAQTAIIIEARIAVVGIRVAPRNHEDREALLGQIFDQRVFRPEIENVIFHDPRRNDEHRLRMDLRRSWARIE